MLIYVYVYVLCFICVVRFILMIIMDFMMMMMMTMMTMMMMMMMIGDNQFVVLQHTQDWGLWMSNCEYSEARLIKYSMWMNLTTTSRRDDTGTVTWIAGDQLERTLFQFFLVW